MLHGRDQAFEHCLLLQKELSECNANDCRRKFSILKKWMGLCLPVFQYLMHPLSNWGSITNNFDLIDCFLQTGSMGDDDTESDNEQDGNYSKIPCLFDYLDLLQSTMFTMPTMSTREMVSDIASWCICHPQYVPWLRAVINKSVNQLQQLLGPGVSIMAIEFALEAHFGQSFS